MQDGIFLRRHTTPGIISLLCAALALFTCTSCAGLARQPDPNRPRAENEPPYPVMLNASDARRQRALGVWATLTDEAGATTSAPVPELHPVTATLRALPDASTFTTPMRLPPVGGDLAGRKPTDEETRESLRRFIVSAAPLLGVDPADLSLVEYSDQTNGVKRARYQQNPFLYPLRGGYGVVAISFTPDRQVVSLSSTAIPATNRLERLLNTIRPQLLTPKDVAARLNQRALTYTDAHGIEQTITVGASDQLTVRELVVYPILRADNPAALAFHFAWEVAISHGGAPFVLYVDAVSGETLAATPATAITPTTSSAE